MRRCCCSSASGPTCSLPRDADLARAFAGRGGGPDSIEVGMLDEAAAREILADLEHAGRRAQGRGGEEGESTSLKPPGQVVDLPTPREEKRPDDARFVSEHDSSVEHETKKYGRFEDNARQGSREGTASVPRPAAPARRRPAGDADAGSRPLPARPGTPGTGGARRAPGQRERRAQRRATRAGRGDPGAGRGGRCRSRAAAARAGARAVADADRGAARARDRRRHAGRAARRRRWRRDRAQLEALAIRFVLQPRQAAGRGALAPR